MDSTPSNGSSLRARTRKANTSPGQAPSGANGKLRATSRRVAVAAPVGSTSLPPMETFPAIAIEDVRPEIDGGHWPVKRVVGDEVEVSADIFKEGHDLLQARIIYRAVDEPDWREAPMRAVENDRWAGAF